MTRRLKRLLRMLEAKRRPVVPPYVCPGCCAVNGHCAPWCPDAALETTRYDADERGCDDDDGWIAYDDGDND